jgi:hypothetical protein
MCEDDCDMGPSGGCMFKRLLPAISLASGYVDRGNCCSAVVWRTRVRRKWTRLARELSEAAGLVGSQPHAHSAVPAPERHSSLAQARVRARIILERASGMVAMEMHGHSGQSG